MKCPKCQREHTLKHVENNAVVCDACGSRFALPLPAQAAAPKPQPPTAPSSSNANRSPEFLAKIVADGKRVDAPTAVPQSPTANVDDDTLSAPLDGVNHIADAPEPTSVSETYSLRDEPTPPHVNARPFAARDAETPAPSTPRKADAFPQTPPQKQRPSLFCWSGRATQREFLGAVGYYLLYSLLLGIVLGVLFCVLGALSEANFGALRVGAGLGMFVVGLAGAAGGVVVTLILFAASARRLRDAGLSPYLTLLHFVASLPLTIFLAVYPGRNGQTNAQKPESRSQSPQHSRPSATSDPCNALSFKQFKRFLHWNGRATRREFLIALGYYFGGAFALFALLLVPTIVCIALGDSRNDALQFVGGIGLLGVGGVALLGSALIHWLLLTASAQRLRDAALSPWLTLLHLVISLPFCVFLAVYVAPDADDASPTAFNDRN